MNHNNKTLQYDVSRLAGYADSVFNSGKYFEDCVTEYESTVDDWTAYMFDSKPNIVEYTLLRCLITVIDNEVYESMMSERDQDFGGSLGVAWSHESVSVTAGKWFENSNYSDTRVHKDTGIKITRRFINFDETYRKLLHSDCYDRFLQIVHDQKLLDQLIDYLGFNGMREMFGSEWRTMLAFNLVTA